MTFLVTFERLQAMELDFHIQSLFLHKKKLKVYEGSSTCK